MKLTKDDISNKKHIILEFKKIKQIRQSVTQLRPITDYLSSAHLEEKTVQEISNIRDEFIASIKNSNFNFEQFFVKLEKIKDAYIENYFTAHSKSRLTSKGEAKLNNILNSEIYRKNLEFRNIKILDTSNLDTEIEDLGKLKKCTDLQKKDLDRKSTRLNSSH